MKVNEPHTFSLRQTECLKKGETITAAVYLYQADNDGVWGELRFDFESSTAEIVKLADWDTVKSNVFAKAVIRFVHRFPTDCLPYSSVISANSSAFKNHFPADRINIAPCFSSTNRTAAFIFSGSGVDDRFPDVSFAAFPPDALMAARRDHVRH